jgi:hypothetical protein
MVDEKDALSTSRLAVQYGVDQGGAVGLLDRLEQRRSLEPRLALLLGWIGVEQQRGACAHLRHALRDADGAQSEPGVHGAVEADLADRTPVPGAHGLLVVLDELHRPQFGRTGDGHGPGVRDERVERVVALAQHTLHVIDGVN